MSKLIARKSVKKAESPDAGDWNTEASVVLSKTTSNVCVWEQKIDAYLQFVGVYWNDGVPDPQDPNPPAPNLVKLINLDRAYNIVVQNNIFIISAADGSTTPFAFQLGGIAGPQIAICKRDTECNQVIKVVEHSVYVNGGQNLLVPGTLIFALLGTLYIIPPFPICEDSSTPSALKAELIEASKKLNALASSDDTEKVTSLSVRVD